MEIHSDASVVLLAPEFPPLPEILIFPVSADAVLMNSGKHLNFIILLHQIRLSPGSEPEGAIYHFCVKQCLSCRKTSCPDFMTAYNGSLIASVFGNMCPDVCSAFLSTKGGML
ncbi:hypothetical protein CDAR_370351 [Caerostris darwini]|uniref:Uncharacterized protein n=1 Tax=Caerostris darwini TaxID=1538125 RepID=A0AAV4NKY6_9ARAC|nr:hypothetical protein CDAR_370351 [Caerostris darwini]